MPEPTDPPVLRFGDFELDVANARLSRAGTPVELPPKSFELLVCLARRPQSLVLKDELLDMVWGRRFVSEGAVKTVVSELRAALGDDARAPRWIETVQRRGYRFIGTLQDDASPPTAAPADPAAPTATQPADPLPDHLPPAGLPPVGRDEAIAALAARLDDTPLLTLTGPGGVGKSTLALAVAHARRTRHADGAWWLPLAPLAPAVTDAAALRSALARTLRIAPLGTGSDDELLRALRGQRLLLVLDNAEHLLDVLAPWLAAWSPHLPGVRLLVTSREPLQLPGEQVWRVDPLPVPADDDDAAGSDAVRLFAGRVAARLQGFEPGDAQRQAMARICRALDGLPLALELAAARVPVLGVHGLADHLADDDGSEGHRLALLTQGARTAAPHQRTLRATLDWSHALLTPAEQRVLQRLSVFRGGFTPAAARAVCAGPGEDPWAVLDTLATLTDKSMLVGAAPDDTEARVGMLESVREYAAEQLEAAGDADATARRHLMALAAHFAAADAAAIDEPLLPWLARLEPELENLRAALRWGRAHADDDEGIADAWIALAADSARFWQRLGLAAEGGRWMLAVRDRAMRHPDPLRRAAVEVAFAALCRFTPLLSTQEHLAGVLRAGDAYAARGDALREYYARYLAWGLALEIGEDQGHHAHVERMQALVQPGWGLLRRRFMRSAWAQDERLEGRNEAFLAASREDLAGLQALGAQAESWAAGHMLMMAEHDRGQAGRALAIGQSVLDGVRAAGRLRAQAQLLAMHTAMRADAGDVEGTRAALDEALPTLGTMQATELLWLAMAWLAAHEGRTEDAARLLGWFESPQRECGAYGPRTFTRRSAAALAARLDEALGADARAALHAAAAGLGDAEGVRLGLRRPEDDRRRHPRAPATGSAPGTDGNPTAS